MNGSHSKDIILVMDPILSIKVLLKQPILMHWILN